MKTLYRDLIRINVQCVSNHFQPEFFSGVYFSSITPSVVLIKWSMKLYWSQWNQNKRNQINHFGRMLFKNALFIDNSQFSLASTCKSIEKQSQSVQMKRFVILLCSSDCRWRYFESHFLRFDLSQCCLTIDTEGHNLTKTTKKHTTDLEAPRV